MRLLFLVIFLFASFAGAETLEERVQRLEATLSEMSDRTYLRQNSVQTFFAENLILGGFFENSITSIWGPDTPTQTVADSHRLGINISAEIRPRIRLITQTTMGFSYAFRNEHNNPNHGSSLIATYREYGDVTFGSLLSQAFAEYDLGTKAKIQAGLGYTPFGKAYQVRDPVLFYKRRGPQLIRTSGINRVVIADPFWKGLHLTGSFDDAQNFQYNLYTHSPLDHSGRLGVGGRFASQKGPFIAGLSFQQGHQVEKPYLTYGVDLQLNGDFLVLTGEWATLRSDLADTQSFYFQIATRWLSQSLVIFLDTDYLKNPLGQTTLGSGAVNDPYIKWEHTLGVNYLFYPNIKARFELIYHDYTGVRAVLNGQNRDYFSGSVSSGISF